MTDEPTLPDLLTGRRLRLPLITADEAMDMHAGRRRPNWHPDFPREDDLDATGMTRAAFGPAAASWGPRALVRGDGTVFGTIGFFGPPESAGDDVPEAEVGYGMVEEARGRGLGTEALRLVLAETDRLGVRVRASVSPDNTASMKLLAKCGFTEIRAPREGGELVLARPLTARE